MRNQGKKRDLLKPSSLAKKSIKYSLLLATVQEQKFGDNWCKAWMGPALWSAEFLLQLLATLSWCPSPLFPTSLVFVLNCLLISGAPSLTFQYMYTAYNGHMGLMS